MVHSAHNSGGPATAHTLGETMGTPSNQPAVVVLDRTYQEESREPKEKPLNAAEDLWLSTVDGRFSSQPIPIRVGPLSDIQTFYVHKEVLVKADWFQKALCGGFRETEDQVIDLPEEDPAIFHFVVAFLYEGRYDPIKSAATALEPLVDKGKAVAVDDDTGESSDTSSNSSGTGSGNNSTSTRPRWRRRVHHRSPNQEADEAVAEKRPGLHRPGCRCPVCLNRQDLTRCWHCGVARYPRPWVAGGHQGPPPPQPHPQPHLQPHMHPPGAAFGPPRPFGNPPPPRGADELVIRIMGEDMQTWLLAYELNLDVYICANRYLMDGFRNAVMRSCIDMLETAGTDAAHPQVLRLCEKLFVGVPETDPLLKMVLARVGFLQPLLWKRAMEETSEFLVAHPEIAAMMLRETVLRQEATTAVPNLPSMENVWRMETPPAPQGPADMYY